MSFRSIFKNEIFKRSCFAIAVIQLVLLNFVTSAHAGRSKDDEEETLSLQPCENVNFDSERIKTNPNKLIADLYQEGNILALGEVNHSNLRSSQYLKELISRVGLDRNLKFIAVENSYELEDLFREASIRPLTRELIYKHDLTGSPVYNIVSNPILVNEILPLIQELNKKRPSKNPLLLVPVDFTGATDKSRSNEKQFGFDFDTSWDRENGTKKGFQRLLENVNLKKGDKVILLYHIGHLFRGFTAKLPKINFSKKMFETEAESPANWLSMLLSEDPQLVSMTKIVALDEKDSKWAKHGHFLLSQRQSNRYPNQDFAIRMEPFLGCLTEKGNDVREPDSFRHSEAEKYILPSEVTLPGMIDALIWTHAADAQVQMNNDALAKLLKEFTSF